MSTLIVRRVLVACRGPLARHAVRRFRAQQVETVAAFSLADADLPAVSEADFDVYLGEGPSAQVTNDPVRVVAAAMDAGCDAIYLGHGPRARNPALRSGAADANLLVVGPNGHEVEGILAPTVLVERAAGVGLEHSAPLAVRHDVRKEMVDLVVGTDGTDAVAYAAIDSGQGIVGRTPDAERFAPALWFVRSLRLRGVFTVRLHARADGSLAWRGLWPHPPPAWALVERVAGIDLPAVQRGLLLEEPVAPAVSVGPVVGCLARLCREGTGMVDGFRLPAGQTGVVCSAVEVGTVLNEDSPWVLAEAVGVGPDVTAAQADLRAVVDACTVGGVKTRWDEFVRASGRTTR